MKNVIAGEKIYFTHFYEEDFEFLAEYQWDNEFLRHLTWDTFHPWNVETWKTFEGDPNDNE